MNWFSKLREDRYNIAFGEIERETSNVYVGCITVIGMPGSRWRAMDGLEREQPKGALTEVHRTNLHTILQLTLV